MASTSSSTIIDQVRSNPPESWEQVFKECDSELEHISQILERRGNFVPRREDIFNAFRLTRLQDVKVVLLGQDPYHTVVGGQPVACGLSFSVRPDSEVPPSLKNMYLELSRSIPGFRPPKHGDLRAWASEGVMLLNASLTCDVGKADSHKGFWLPFIIPVLEKIVEVNPGAIFILLGSRPQEVISRQKNLAENVVKLETTHPSPFSANKGFIGSNIFVECNKILGRQQKSPINWQLPLEVEEEDE